MQGQGFIFGGDTGITPEALERRRKIAEQMMAAGRSAPRNLGEGIHSAASSIAGALMARRAGKEADRQKAEFDARFKEVAPNYQGMIDLANSPYATSAHSKVIEALMKGAPNYKRGTNFHPGGQAVVGENGPEVLDLPVGARIMPTMQNTSPGNFVGGDLEAEDADFLFSLPEPMKNQAIERIQRGENAPDVLMEIFQQQKQMQQYDPASQQRLQQQGEPPMTPDFDGRELLGPESSLQPQGRFDDARQVQTAQASLSDVVSDANRPVADEKMTEGQSKDVVYFRRGSAANTELSSLESAVTQWTDNFAGNFGAIGRLFQDADYQKGMRAANEFLAMVLRKDTGAAVTKQEFDLYGPMYIPMPGDKPETIEAKRQAREQFLISMYDASGPRTRDVQRNAAQETTKPVDQMSDDEFMQWLQTQGGS